ncbi:MAG TPA: hypothetical protein VFT14_03560 [Solirubrobacterales bacterium]|nr:hypothetical protein [Solirubrobacterales bacterium]
MDEGGGEGIRDRISAHGEGALGELAQFLVDNPWLNQALQVALGARERASQASASAIRNLNLPTGGDVDRLARRLRGISERLEAVEDSLDEINRQLAELRRERAGATRRPPSTRD